MNDASTSFRDHFSALAAQYAAWRSRCSTRSPRRCRPRRRASGRPAAAVDRRRSTLPSASVRCSLRIPARHNWRRIRPGSPGMQASRLRSRRRKHAHFPKQASISLPSVRRGTGSTTVCSSVNASACWFRAAYSLSGAIRISRLRRSLRAQSETSARASTRIGQPNPPTWIVVIPATHGLSMRCLGWIARCLRTGHCRTLSVICPACRPPRARCARKARTSSPDIERVGGRVGRTHSDAPRSVARQTEVTKGCMRTRCLQG